MTEPSISTSPGIGPIRLDRVIEALPAGFDTMRSEARAEGYRFLERLAADWDTGALRFAKPGEILLAAHSEGALAGIGGLTVDPAVAEGLRMRRFYVRPAFRRHGIGQKLAAALIGEALVRGCSVMVNAAAGSAPFWESLGFIQDERDRHTHCYRASRDK